LYSSTDGIFVYPQSLAHYQLCAAVRSQKLFFIRYDDDNKSYKCIDHNGIVRIDRRGLETAKDYVLQTFASDYPNFAKQYQIKCKKQNRRDWLYVLHITKIGWRLVDVLNDNMVWNIKRRQADIEETISYIRKQAYFQNCCNLQIIEPIRSMRNRRIRNAILDQAYQLCCRSVRIDQYCFDAEEYYRSIFESGSISNEQALLVHTIPDQELRKSILKKIVYFKLSSPEYDHNISSN
jgi:hypothetical protein